MKRSIGLAVVGSLSIALVFVMVGCANGGSSSSLGAPAATAPTPAGSQSSGPTSEPSGEPTFTVTQRGSDGPEVTIFVFDPERSLTAARGAAEQDETPLIETELEPRIGAVPGAPSQLRVLWGGLVCDTTYEVWVGTNEIGGPNLDVIQGPRSHPDCDTLGIRRGVVLTFSSPVDATKATGAFHGSTPSVEASASGTPTFEVKQQGSSGPEITIFIFDPEGSLTAARGATEQDEVPFIETEVEPRLGAVPGEPNVLRALWGGGGCDTSFTVWIGTNERGGPYVDVSQGAPSHPVCDSLGIRRGVVLTFSAPVDATKAKGAMHGYVPG